MQERQEDAARSTGHVNQTATNRHPELAPKGITEPRTLALVASELQDAVSVVARGKEAAALIPGLRAELDKLIGKSPRKAREKKTTAPA
jgi:hypothetical protein